jgi:hypothetical protein
MQILQEAQSFPPVAFTKDYIDNIKHPQIWFPHSQKEVKNAIWHVSLDG